MRTISQIIVHCSATKPDQDIGADEIRNWHTRDRGFSDIGYHFVIRRDGTLDTGRPIKKAGAHARGHNFNSLGVCLVGGVDDEGRSVANFTMLQYSALYSLLRQWVTEHGDIKIIGHRDLPGVAKDCPCFDVRAFLEHTELGA